MPPSSIAPSDAGASSAPSRPSQPITCARQRTANAVAAAPIDERAEQRDRPRHELVDRTGDDERAERPRDAHRGRDECGLRAVAVLAQPRAEAEEAERDHAGERGARAFADPPARDRHREQEREPGEHGEAAEPGEHAAADEILEVARRPGGPGACGRGGGEVGARRRDGGRGRRRRGGRLRRRRRALRPADPVFTGACRAGVLKLADTVLERRGAPLQGADPVLNHGCDSFLLTTGR